LNLKLTCMKRSLLPIFFTAIFFSCSDSRQEIIDRQLEITNKVDSLDKLHDSLSAVMENSSDKRIVELVKLQLTIKKIDEHRAYLLKTHDSLGAELKSR